MPHAVLVELDCDGAGAAAAFAGELPGCAAFAGTPEDAVAAIPARVGEFVRWLNGHGERLSPFVGGNWYEVERAAATHADGATRRAMFGLDDLPPSDDEFARYVRWLELAREELAEALDRSDESVGASLVAPIARQDVALCADLGSAAPPLGPDPVDALFAARDALSEALAEAGPAAPGARGILRIAIADDLRVAAEIRAASS